jgi:hypothetical protein
MVMRLPSVEVACAFGSGGGYVARRGPNGLRVTTELLPEPGVYSLWAYRYEEDELRRSGTEELEWYYVGESGNVRNRMLKDHFSLKTSTGRALHKLLSDDQCSAELRMIGDAKLRFAGGTDWLPLDLSTSSHRELVESAILVALEYHVDAPALNYLRTRQGIPQPVMYEDDFPEVFRSPRGTPGARYRDDAEGAGGA